MVEGGRLYRGAPGSLTFRRQIFFAIAFFAILVFYRFFFAILVFYTFYIERIPLLLPNWVSGLID